MMLSGGPADNDPFPWRAFASSSDPRVATPLRSSLRDEDVEAADGFARRLPGVDGWIYFEMPENDFHPEIMLSQPQQLLELETEEVPALDAERDLHAWLPTQEEWAAGRASVRTAVEEIASRHRLGGAVLVRGGDDPERG